MKTKKQKRKLGPLERIERQHRRIQRRVDILRDANAILEGELSRWKASCIEQHDWISFLENKVQDIQRDFVPARHRQTLEQLLERHKLVQRLRT